MITAAQLKSLFPKIKNEDKWIIAMTELFPKFNITNSKRIAMFLAQCGHESGGFSVFSENLNYSANSLNIVFSKYFKNAGRDANLYAKKPEQIANIVYANRMGNDLPGDGFKYRGRGPIQITGRNNYKQLSIDTGLDCLNNPDILASDIDASLLSAIWFWNKNKLNNFADIDDVKGSTRIINGGFNGLEDRTNLWKSISSIIGNTYNQLPLTAVSDIEEKASAVVSSSIQRGSSGDIVKQIQTALKLKADGQFGINTENAVKKFQKEHSLLPDGVVGPKTLEKLLG